MRGDAFAGWVSFLVIALAATVALATAKTADPIPDTTDQVEKFAQAGIGRSVTWKVDVTDGAAVNLWDDAPAEATTAVRVASRNVKVSHCDVPDTASAVHVRLGPATDTPALSTTAGGDPLLSAGSYVQFQVRPVSGVGVDDPDDASIPLWAIADSGATVRTCVTIYW
jgi:hypothetical protein